MGGRRDREPIFVVRRQVCSLFYFAHVCAHGNVLILRVPHTRTCTSMPRDIYTETPMERETTRANHTFYLVLRFISQTVVTPDCARTRHNECLLETALITTSRTGGSTNKHKRRILIIRIQHNTGTHAKGGASAHPEHFKSVPGAVQNARCSARRLVDLVKSEQKRAFKTAPRIPP